jgi:hypothetical protein
MIERALQRIGELDLEAVYLEKELQALANHLEQLEYDQGDAEESKYETVLGGKIPRIVSLNALKAELVETVSLSFEPEGKTKDERYAELIRYVKANYKEYGEYENRIHDADRKLRAISQEKAAKERQHIAVQKRLWSVQIKIESYGKIVGYYTSQQGGELSGKLSVMERRITEQFDAIKQSLQDTIGDVKTQKTILKEMVNAL